jgi:hypothetical protein
VYITVELTPVYDFYVGFETILQKIKIKFEIVIFYNIT